MREASVRRWWLRMRQGLVVGAGLALAGCTLGPEPARPGTAAGTAAGYIHGNSRTAEPATDGVSPWWQHFGDPVTSELVELALANNTDLHAAAARVLEAEAALRRAGGSRRPQMTYSGSASTQQSSFVMPGMGRQKIDSTTYSTDLKISWQADLFGKLKRSQQSARASLLAEESGQAALRHSIVAQVVRSRVQIAAVARALAIAHDIRSSWESTLATVERRYRNGLVKAIDLHLARENLSSAQAAEVASIGQLEQARLALDVMLGRRPGTGQPLPDTLPELPSPEPIPLGLPADLLDRRPDLRQAEQQLASATYGVGAALADLYPSLTLTGSTGTASDTLSDLVSTDTLVYNMVANLVGPIFSGGQRRADVDAARARAEQAAAAYSGAVLNALREVEEALVLGKSAEQRLVLTEQRISEARAADEIARARYQRGVETLLVVLDTERRLRSAEEALINTKTDLWNARIDLFLALGGDWLPEQDQNSPELARTTASETSKPQKTTEQPTSEVS